MFVLLSMMNLLTCMTNKFFAHFPFIMLFDKGIHFYLVFYRSQTVLDRWVVGWNSFLSSSLLLMMFKRHFFKFQAPQKGFFFFFYAQGHRMSNQYSSIHGQEKGNAIKLGQDQWNTLCLGKIYWKNTLM